MVILIAAALSMTYRPAPSFSLNEKHRISYAVNIAEYSDGEGLESIMAKSMRARFVSIYFAAVIAHSRAVLRQDTS